MGTAAAFALAVQDIDRHGVVGLQGANHLFDAFFPASSVMNTNQDKGLILVLFGQLDILGQSPPTWATPRCPKVDDHDLALVVVDINGFTAPVFQGQLGKRFPFHCDVVGVPLASSGVEPAVGEC